MDLASLEAGSELDTDLVIIGGGVAGLTIARELFDHHAQVLVLESGLLVEHARTGVLNAVESIGEPKTNAQVERRVAFHSANACQSVSYTLRSTCRSCSFWAGTMNCATYRFF